MRVRKVSGSERSSGSRDRVALCFYKVFSDAGQYDEKSTMVCKLYITVQ